MSCRCKLCRIDLKMCSFLLLQSLKFPNHCLKIKERLSVPVFPLIFYFNIFNGDTGGIKDARTRCNFDFTLEKSGNVFNVFLKRFLMWYLEVMHRFELTVFLCILVNLVIHDVLHFKYWGSVRYVNLLTNISRSPIFGNVIWLILKKNCIPIVFATSYIILQELDLIFLIHLSTFLCILD